MRESSGSYHDGCWEMESVAAMSVCCRVFWESESQMDSGADLAISYLKCKKKRRLKQFT